ncbi:MAG: FAD-dependent oxidoreductase [Nitrososphaerota archaeon]|nr:FAD-dependent oxidoreductase [Candidatus Bathyarchaeota archaeon]MDW8023728.1 FAD-dependent oxidoreductase [Nitrososphaerota archaeon]
MRSLRKFSYFNAKSVEEAASILAKYEGKAWPIAGGTDLLTILRFQPLPEELYPEALVNLKTIVPSLEYVKEEGGVLKIGALTRLEDIAKNSLVKENYGAIAEACGKVGSPHLREMGTIGGNISQFNRCWYFRKEDNRFYCLRKGCGGKAWAMMGDNRYHSIFGCVKINGAEPCVNGCPNNIDIPSYMSKIKSGDIEGAARILLSFNPIPSVTGRVCPHYCEEECSRNVLDEPLAVRAVERFIGDYILENVDKLVEPPKIEIGKSVAIVGSGPAGLSAAYYLRKLGYRVTIFEKENAPGGVLTYGIPPFRLPKKVIEKLVEAYKRLLKVEFKTNTTVGRDVLLEELMAKYDAVFLAIGAWKEAAMRIPGEELMEAGLDFLKKINSGVRKAPGKKVAVIGGGNVAIDVARVLLRLGAEPTILYRRTEGEMPALKEEVKVAKEEGVKFEFLTQPIKAEKRGDKILLKCLRMKLGPLDATGRPTPIPIEGSEFTVEYDAVIKATGENPDLSFIPAEFLDEKGRLKLDASTYRVGKNLFAGGDVVTGPATVTEAIAAGRKAAICINEYLTQKGKGDSKTNIEGEVKFEKVNVECLKKMSRVIVPEIAVADRINSLDVEDVIGLSMSEVEEEVSRCLNCGCVMAHPSDVAPALIALNAKVVTNKRTIPIEKFFKPDNLRTVILDADEIIVEIQVPKPKAGTKSKFMKFSLRSSIDFPIVNCATAIRSENGVVEQARICLNAVAPIPYRATKAEEYIKGKQITEQTAEEAAEKEMENANPLPYNTYKAQIAKALIKRTILACK